MVQDPLPSITGVVLMVPEARALVPSAHITILAPFGTDGGPTVAELADVEEFFADQTSFAYELTQVCTFPDGLRYLSPEPATRFSRMTHALHQLFPEYKPYDGRFDLVVPHLTIPDDASVGRLPIQAHAREATLLHLEDGVFTELASFPFGRSAA
ncbi:MAG TPA: 2'-5' RNA ligase family protein [Marmoricola sp.]|nr:2'-5' RNA ligase family protein [Marmoricola sp.]